MNLPIQLLHPAAQLPTRGTEHAAGLDLYAAEACEIWPQRCGMIDTSIALAIPHGYYGKIEARSGLALKYGVMIQAGIVDSDYRGTVRVLAFVAGTDIWAIKAGDKIAQLLILPVPEFEPVKVEALGETTRGAGGFGSTGR